MGNNNSQGMGKEYNPDPGSDVSDISKVPNK